MAAEALNMADLVIVGAGGHATSVADLAICAGFRVRCFVDPARAGGRLLGIAIESFAPDGAVCVAIGDNSARARVYEGLRGKFVFPALVHPSATVANFSTIGDGTVLMAGAIVGPDSHVGRFCILNTRASIDHNCRMEDFSSLAPGAITGGHVSIGRRSAISIGAVVKQRMVIGDDSIVGASSYVDSPVANTVVAYGTPARKVRDRQPNDPYLY